MKLTIGNLNYIIKKLKQAANDSAVVTSISVDPPLTRGESSVLDYLVTQDEAKSIRNIVEETGLVQSWVSTVVKSLDKRGWVTVGRDETDKRVTTVKLTDELKQGANLTLHSDASVALDRLIAHATDDEKELLTRGIEMLYDVLRRQEKID